MKTSFEVTRSLKKETRFYANDFNLDYEEMKEENKNSNMMGLL